MCSSAATLWSPWSTHLSSCHLKSLVQDILLAARASPLRGSSPRPRLWWEWRLSKAVSTLRARVPQTARSQGQCSGGCLGAVYHHEDAWSIFSQVLCLSFQLTLTTIL